MGISFSILEKGDCEGIMTIKGVTIPLPLFSTDIKLPYSWAKHEVCISEKICACHW